MKKIIIILLVLALIPSKEVLSAQNKITKIACIDVQRIIDKVSSDRLLKQVLSKKKDTFIKGTEGISKEIQKLKAILITETQKLSEKRKFEIKKEIIEREEELREMLNKQRKSINSLERRLSVDIIRNLYTVVKRIAIRNGFSIVIEKGTVVIYADSNSDITKDVLLELEKQKEKLSR